MSHVDGSGLLSRFMCSTDLDIKLYVFSDAFWHSVLLLYPERCCVHIPHDFTYSFRKYIDPEAQPWTHWVKGSFYVAKSWSLRENVKVLPEIIRRQIDKDLLFVNIFMTWKEWKVWFKLLGQTFLDSQWLYFIHVLYSEM